MSKKSKKKGISFKTITYTMHFHGKEKREQEALLRFLCHIAKNVYNNALYALRQSYFDTKTIPTYYDLNKIVKDLEDSKILNSYAVICINRDAYDAMNNFLTKKDYEFPKYLTKKGYYPFITEQIQYDEKGKEIRFPLSNLVRTGKIFQEKYADDVVNAAIEKGFCNQSFGIKIPKEIVGKRIKRMSIVPKENATIFEVCFTYIDDKTDSDKKEENGKYLSMDLGVRNLATCVDSTSKKSFIIDGKIANSKNRYFNKEISKEMARIASIEENTYIDKKGIKRVRYQSRKLSKLYYNRINYMKTYMNQAAKMIVDYCIENDIHTIVMGYNKGFKRKGIEGGTNKENARANQNFLQLPIAKLKNRLIVLCKENGITLEIINESYTSICSFYDNEDICKHDIYVGTRTSRLFITQDNRIVNADVNGACNILKKYLLEKNHENEEDKYIAKNDLEIIQSLRLSGITVPVRWKVS